MPDGNFLNGFGGGGGGGCRGGNGGGTARRAVDDAGGGGGRSCASGVAAGRTGFRDGVNNPGFERADGQVVVVALPFLGPGPVVGSVLGSLPLAIPLPPQR